jgi:hypothetical protein
MSDPFVIPKLIDPTALSVRSLGRKEADGSAFIKELGKLTLQQCRA